MYACSSDDEIRGNLGGWMPPMCDERATRDDDDTAPYTCLEHGGWTMHD